jgi:peptide/nickel transport system permease protein
MLELLRARRFERAAFWACAPALLLVLSSGVYCLLSSRSPERFDLELAWAGPSAERFFGSGDAGVDLVPLVLHATFRVLVLAATVALIGFFLGVPLGCWAGLSGGRLQRWTLRACDLVQSFPSFLLALAVLSAVKVPSRWHIGLVFSLSAWAPFARIALVQARALSAAQFVEAARALGLTRGKVVWRHVMPNLFGPVAIQLGTIAAGVVLGETALGFVGLGPADGVSLGAVLEQGSLGMLRAPHVIAVGAIAVILVSGALQLASEGVRRWGAPSSY